MRRTPFYLLEPGTTLRSGRGCIYRAALLIAKSLRGDFYADYTKRTRRVEDGSAVRKPPDTPEWAGIIDRLKRASAE